MLIFHDVHFKYFAFILYNYAIPKNINRGSQKQSRLWLCQNMMEATGRLRLKCTNVCTFTRHAAHVNSGAAEACSGIRHRRKHHIPFTPTVALSARTLWVQQAEGAGDRMASLGLKAIVGESKKCFAEVALGQKLLTFLNVMFQIFLICGIIDIPIEICTCVLRCFIIKYYNRLFTNSINLIQ